MLYWLSLSGATITNSAWWRAYYALKQVQAFKYDTMNLSWFCSPSCCKIHHHHHRRSWNNPQDPHLNIVDVNRRCGIRRDPVSGNKRQDSHLLHLFGPHVSLDRSSGCHIYQHLTQSTAAASGGSNWMCGTARASGRWAEIRQGWKKTHFSEQGNKTVLLYLQDVQRWYRAGR